jgi:hypothetical protein
VAAELGQMTLIIQYQMQLLALVVVVVQADLADLVWLFYDMQTHIH